MIITKLISSIAGSAGLAFSICSGSYLAAHQTAGHLSPLSGQSNIKFSDPEFIEYAVRDVHPNYIAAFGLAVDLLSQKGKFKNSSTPTILKTVYEQMALYVWKSRIIEGYGIEGDDHTGIGSYQALVMIEKFRFPRYLGELTQKSYDEVIIELAKTITFLESKNKLKLEFKSDRFTIIDPTIFDSWRDGSIKPSTASIEAAILFTQWASGNKAPSSGLHGLTLGSTRTPPALPSALSQFPASSAPLSASVQAGPVSLVR